VHSSGKVKRGWKIEFRRQNSGDSRQKANADWRVRNVQTEYRRKKATGNRQEAIKGRQ
jgi:hypothetical protein